MAHSPSTERPDALPGWSSAPTPPVRPDLPPPPSPWVAGSSLPPPPRSWTSGATPPAAPDRPGVSLQNLLLALGTGLVAVAALVFTAVNWDRLGASIQGGALLAATGAAAAGALACARRRMPATAESLGLVAVLFALADAHAARVAVAPSGSASTWWAGALAVVAAAAWGFGRVAGIRSPRIVAALLAQVPLLLLLTDLRPAATVAELLVVAQVAVVVLALSVGRRQLPEARLLAGSFAGTCVGGVLVAAAIEAVVEDGAARRGPALVLLAVAALAALVARLHPEHDATREPALALATGLGLVATWVAATTIVSAELAPVVVGLVGVVVVAVGLRVGARWGAGPARTAAAAVGLTSLPLLGAGSLALAAASEVPPRAWDLDLATRATSLAGHLTAPGSGAAVGLHLVVLAALLGATAPVVGTRARWWSGVALAALAAVVAPLVVPLSIGGAGAVALAAAVLAVVAGLVVDRAGSLAAGVSAGIGPMAVALLWAAATPTATLVALGAVVLLGLAVATTARDRGLVALAAGGGAVIVVASGLGAGLLLLANDASPASCWVVGAVVAGVVALVGALLLDADAGGEVPTAERRGRDRTLAQAIEVSAWGIQLVALLAVVELADRGAVSVLLAAGTVLAAAHAVRPGRRQLGWVAVAHALPLGWLRLAELGVRAPEPYALPVAAVLLGAGFLAGRRSEQEGRHLGSWVTLGPALVVAAVPTVWWSLLEGGAVRPTLALVAGAAVLAAGALHGKRAPVDVGTVVVGLLALRQVAPVVRDLPSWAGIGTAGALLLAVGATFEQRRRDLDGVRHRYASLD